MKWFVMPAPSTPASKNPITLWNLLKGNDPEKVKPWLRWHPSEMDACVSARGSRLPDPLTADEIEEIKRAHQRWSGDTSIPAETLKSIETLANPSVRVIVAGQQPGILAGPLFCIYKALGAVELARSLASRHPELQFVPVFWVASEDDDFDEVRRVYWPGEQGQMEEVLIDHFDWSPGKMIGHLPSAPLADLLVSRIEQSTFETEFRKEVLRRVRAAYHNGGDWEGAFCRLMLEMLPHSGLVFVSPLMPWVRGRGASVLQKEARLAGQSARKIIARGAELEGAGLESPLHRHEGAVNFFRVDASGRRRALRLTDGKIHTLPPETKGRETSGETDPSFPECAPEELAQVIARSPQSFAFNVVSRTLIQDSIFPTVAQVIGPGEAAYLGQVESVYEDFGAFAPVRYPRPQVMLISNNVARTLKKYSISPDEALGKDASQLAQKVIERDLSEGIIGEIGQLRERHLRELEELERKAGDNPALHSAFEKLRQSMGKGFELVRERVLYTREEDERQLKQAMIRLESNLFPAGGPQERALNPVAPFMINYGSDWVERVAKLINYEPTAPPQVIQLSRLAEK